MPSKDGLIYHLTCLLYAPYLGKLCDPKNHEFSVKLQISVMVLLWRLLSQQMLPAIKHVVSDTFVFQQDNAPSHRARTLLNSYSKKCQTSFVLISGHQTAQTWNQWIMKSGVLRSRECMNVACTMNSVDELKLRLIDVWNSLQNWTLLTRPSTSGESNWEHACMQMDNILNIYCERVWLTKVMDK